MTGYLSRGIEPRLRDRLERDALVILEGARATGKSRLVEHAVSEGWLQEVRSLVDPTLRSAAEAAPMDFVRGLPHGTAIDEAQLCPAIMLPLKERIENAEPGSILLTGSTRLHRDELGGSDPFAGRVGRSLQLAPLTLGEQLGRPIDLVSHLFSDDPALIEVESSFMRSDVVSRLDQPGLPGMVPLSNRAERRDRSQEYLRQVMARSPLDSLDIQRVNRLARHLAARSSTLLNVQQFAQATELSRETVNKYLARLEEALLVLRLRSWRRSKDKSETDKPKIHFFDAGVAAGVGLMQPADDEQALGRLAETLVVTDLVRQCEWQSQPPVPFHWRWKNRDEVDLVLENVEGRAICVEVKASEQVDLTDFSGIDAFRSAHAAVFHRGFVFYTGSRVLPFGENRWAVPFAALVPPAPAESERSSLAAVVASSRRSQRAVLRGQQSDADAEAQRQAEVREQALAAIEAQLGALAESLTGYETIVEPAKNAQNASRVRFLRVRPTAATSGWSNLLHVQVDETEIRASTLDGNRSERFREPIDDRPIGKVVESLLAETGESIGLALAELDAKFGL